MTNGIMERKRARVAVITRTKNRKILLRRALRSVLEQTFQDWTMVIVNDGGDPADVEELVAAEQARFGDRVRVLHHPQSLGMEAASNAGIRACDSEYVVIHDDDDSWQPRFLEACLGYLDKHASRPKLAGVITHSTRVIEAIEGDEVRVIRSEPYNTWIRAVTLFRMASGNMFPPISFLFRRSILDEIGWYREDLPVLGDWDMHLRFVERYDVGVVFEELANYHHRLTLKEGVYANTVIGGDDHHAYYDAMIRNELLREDVAKNRFGLGVLVNLARSAEDMHRQIDMVAEQRPGETLFGYVKDKVYALAQRANLIDSKSSNGG